MSAREEGRKKRQLKINKERKTKGRKKRKGGEEKGRLQKE